MCSVFFSSKTNKSTPRHRYLNNICVAHPRAPAITRINHLPWTFYPTQFFYTYICMYMYIFHDLLPSMTSAGNYNIGTVGTRAFHSADHRYRT